MNNAVCSCTSNPCTEQSDEKCMKVHFIICLEPIMIWAMRWTCNALLLVLHQATDYMFFSRSLEWLMCPLEHCGLANPDSEYERQKEVALWMTTKRWRSLWDKLLQRKKGQLVKTLQGIISSYRFFSKLMSWRATVHSFVNSDDSSRLSCNKEHISHYLKVELDKAERRLHKKKIKYKSEVAIVPCCKTRNIID